MTGPEYDSAHVRPYDAAYDLAYLASLQGHIAEYQRVQEAVVTRLRANGVSWADIGRRLALSRQGAQQRYGSTPS